MWGGGILNNNNIVNSQNNDGLSFVKTLQNQKSIKNQNISKDISISTNQKTSKNINISKILKTSRYANFFAFSLIELSIVLIIIGLLVAGVTGGKSLIESAKTRALINELNGWKQAVYTFYASKGRLPGDILNRGVLGYGGGTGYNKYLSKDYPAGTFKAPYDQVETSMYSAPFVEMYLEGVTDFKPTPGAYGLNSAGVSGRSGASPFSKVLKKSDYVFFAAGLNYLKPPYIPDAKINAPYLELLISSSSESKPLTIKLLKHVDEKMDDGMSNYGNISASCKATGLGYGLATYEQALNSIEKREDGYCSRFYYYLGF